MCRWEAGSHRTGACGEKCWRVPCVCSTKTPLPRPAPDAQMLLANTCWEGARPGSWPHRFSGRAPRKGKEERHLLLGARRSCIQGEGRETLHFLTCIFWGFLSTSPLCFPITGGWGHRSARRCWSLKVVLSVRRVGLVLAVGCRVGRWGSRVV